MIFLKKNTKNTKHQKNVFLNLFYKSKLALALSGFWSVEAQSRNVSLVTRLKDIELTIFINATLFTIF